MQDLMDIFTRPIAEHRSMCMPARPSEARTVPDDHPRATEMKEVALAYALCSHAGDGGPREIRKRAAAGMGMDQARFDVLLAGHRIVTGRENVLEAHDQMSDDMRTMLMAARLIQRLTGSPAVPSDIASMTGIDAGDAEIVVTMMQQGRRYLRIRS